MRILSLQVGYIGTNCYIVCDTDAQVCTVIDPGGNPEQIISAVSGSNCTAQSILLTHGHYDHTDGVAGLREVWPDIPVYLNHRDQFAGNAHLQQLFPEIPNTLDCDEGDTLTVGGLRFDVMSTPGHSEGSVSFLCDQHLFCGDTLFAGSCGRTDFPGGSTETILKSLRRLGQMDPKLQVYPGHMDTTTIEIELMTNPYLLHAMRNG